MNLSYNNIRNLSYSSSIIFHLILLLIAFLINFALEPRAKEFIELSFGEGGFGTSGGSQGIAMEESGGNTATEEKLNRKLKTKFLKLKMFHFLNPKLLLKTILLILLIKLKK